MNDLEYAKQLLAFARETSNAAEGRMAVAEANRVLDQAKMRTAPPLPAPSDRSLVDRKLRAQLLSRRVNRAGGGSAKATRSDWVHYRTDPRTHEIRRVR